MAETMLRQAGTGEDLKEQEYREMYLELAQGKTTRQIEAILGTYSNAWWSEFGHGRKPVTREAKAALRRAVGLKELAPTVGEALRWVDEDAEVWMMAPTLPSPVVTGEGRRADRVLVTWRGLRGTVILNGGVKYIADVASAAVGGVVTPVTGKQRAIPEWRRCAQARRREIGASWREVIEAGLETLAGMRESGERST